MKVEQMVIVGGIVVFFAVIGTMYLFLDKKTPASYYQQEEQKEKKDGLSTANEDTSIIKPPKSEKQQTQTAPTAAQSMQKTPPPMTIDKTKQYSALMETSEGVIKLRLEAAKTPQTVNNFVALSRSKFYDNTIFHRVVEDFMIQGGDPKGTGTGGPGYTVPAEFDSSLKHVRGAISTARLGDAMNPKKESSGSQFFIVHKDVAQLDGEYTVFGQVTEGLDVVDRIATAEVELSGSGEVSKPVKPVKILNIKIIEE